MSSSSKPFYYSKWLLLLVLYAVLTLISNITTSSEVTEQHVNELNRDEDKPNLVFISDPIFKLEDSVTQFDSEYNVHVLSTNEDRFKEQAEKFNHQLDSLGLSHYHLIGQGVGGSVALHLTVLADEYVRSISLLDANGIEELELLGGFHLNHAIYQAKVLFHSFLYTLVPHFGALEGQYGHIQRSKAQFASDQRLIRPLMAEIWQPSLIIHTQDAKVNESVSVEHHRLLPQSEFIVINDNSGWESQVSEFINRTIEGSTPDRSMVTNLAQQKSIEPFDPADGVKAEGTALLLLMLVIILSTLISEDLTCIGTGLMIARGLIGFFPGTLACLIGIFLGDILLYLAGKWLASSTLHRAPLKWFISEKDIQLSYHWFEAKGPAIIIASRFIPGSRFPTYFSAGAIGASFGMFILYFGVASIIWTPILVGLAVLLGQEMIDYFSIYQDYALWVLFGVLISLFLLFKVMIPSFTYKGRRLLIGWYKRKLSWEFWSPFVVYAPVLFYSIFLWIKHRSITLVTLANPGFKDGGFIKESKSEILDAIQDEKSVARYTLIASEQSNDERVSSVELFMENYQIEFPIVLKPDIGQRGVGVVIPKNATQLKNEIGKFKTDFIVQEYIGGEEYGVFYFRYPGEEKGQIFSITRKKYMNLTGDGKHTLEELILRDPRAVCLAEKHFEQHIDELFLVPHAGKQINLVEVGTHARGSIFYDAINLNTEHLTARIDEISKSTTGFYFGRFDIKVPSEQHLKEGNELKVLELNGVTSEATHIYDPKFGFLYAVRVLIKQWSIAYEIAAQVKKKQSDLHVPGPVHILNLLR